jgi:hypothetical protein
VRQKRASVEIDAGRRLLEEKLRIYTQAGAQGRRNLALDLLTGGAADDRLASAGLGAIAATPLYAFAHAGAMPTTVRADDTGLHPVGEREPKIVIRPMPSRAPARRVERRRPDSRSDARQGGMPRAVPIALLAIMVVSGALTVRSLLDGGAHADTLQAPAAEATTVGILALAEGALQPVRSLTAEPFVAPTAAAAPTAAVLPPAAASPVSVDRFRTILDERFADNQRRWPDNPRSTAWLADGSYHLYAREPGRFVAIGAPIPDEPGDVDVTGTFRKVGGPPGGGYGLVLRDQGPCCQDGLTQGGRFYVFEVGEGDKVGVWRREDDRFVDLVPWTPSEAVRPGMAQNQVRVTAIGERMSFFVNGILVASWTDTILRRGAAGIYVGGDFNEVTLERFTVQVPL